jgi:hypothetical protein
MLHDPLDRHRREDRAPRRTAISRTHDAAFSAQMHDLRIVTIDDHR